MEEPPFALVQLMGQLAVMPLGDLPKMNIKPKTIKLLKKENTEKYPADFEIFFF